jgi:hypothetical protein
MKAENHRVASAPERTEEASHALATLFEAHSEAMAPLLIIVVEAKVTLEAFIDVVGRSCLEAVLQLSAAEIAGPPHRGQGGDDMHWPGTQVGVVTLATPKVRVSKPRLCRKGGGQGAEVTVPAYTALQQSAGLAGGRDGATLVRRRVSGDGEALLSHHGL